MAATVNDAKHTRTRTRAARARARAARAKRVPGGRRVAAAAAAILKIENTRTHTNLNTPPTAIYDISSFFPPPPSLRVIFFAKSSGHRRKHPPPQPRETMTNKTIYIQIYRLPLLLLLVVIAGLLTRLLVVPPLPPQLLLSSDMIFPFLSRSIPVYSVFWPGPTIIRRLRGRASSQSSPRRKTIRSGRRRENRRLANDKRYRPASAVPVQMTKHDGRGERTSTSACKSPTAVDRKCGEHTNRRAVQPAGRSASPPPIRPTCRLPAARQPLPAGKPCRPAITNIIINRLINGIQFSFIEFSLLVNIARTDKIRSTRKLLQ